MELNAQTISAPFRTAATKAAIAEFVARVALLAAGVDGVYFFFFLVVGSPVLAWMNVISVVLYGLAYLMVRRRKLHVAVLLIWLEVFPHAAIGTLMTGWESGFHYLLLMFIPSVVMTNSRRQAQVFVVVLLLFLGTLDAASLYWGPLAPLSGPALQVLKWLNITLFVAMFSALATYFRNRISQAQRHLQVQATVDDLTGLFNRRHFQLAAQRELSRCRRTGASGCLVLMDIDNFKRINDTHGHETGDFVLVTISKLLKDDLRDMDTLSRWGGEEFVLLMPDVQLSDGRAAAERIRRLVEETSVASPSGKIHCTLSFGVTRLTGSETFSDTLARADRALYRSKDEGRNRVSID